MLIGAAALFHAFAPLAYTAFFSVPVEPFVVFYKEPTLRRQFGESYEEYHRTVPRWIPKFRRTQS